MKALGLVVLDKNIFEQLHFEHLFLTLWPTYATNWNGLNNFDGRPPRDHSCEVLSKSNEWFQRRRYLSKKNPSRLDTYFLECEYMFYRILKFIQIYTTQMKSHDQT